MLHLVWNLLTVEFITVIAVALVLGVWVGFLSPRNRNLKGKHVIVTGGSSGIGKYLAIEAIKKGANVSIFARNSAMMEEARTEILKHVVFPNQQKVSYFSVDVGGSYEHIIHSVQQAEDEMGPTFLLMNCAGYAKAARFEEMPIEDVKRLMSVNYFGSAQVSHAVVSGMKGRREGGILFVSSQGGLCGVFGFAAYSASKFALRGLAESLAMELKPYNVSVTMGFPPDTDTPGFAKENIDKPKETQLISESAGLQSPESVAKGLLSSTLKGQFISTLGVEGFIQSTVCIGMAPFTSAFDLVIQVLTMGLFRLISVCYLYKFHRIVVKCMVNRDQKKRSE